MRESILNHYRAAGTYTYAGAYADVFRSLPDDPRAVCGGKYCSRICGRAGKAARPFTIFLKFAAVQASRNMVY